MREWLEIFMDFIFHPFLDLIEVEELSKLFL